MERNCFCEKKLLWVLSHVSNSGNSFEFAEFAFYVTLLYIWWKVKKKRNGKKSFLWKKMPWVLSHVSNSGHLFEFAEFAFFVTLLYIYIYMIFR